MISLLLEAIGYAKGLLRFGASVLTHRMCSLTAMSIRNSVLRALRKSKVVPVAVIRALPPNFVFELPSVTAMSAFIHGIVLGVQASPGAESSTGSDEADAEAYPEIDSVPDLDQNLVKLREGSGEPPLIMLHGTYVSL